MQAEDGLAVLGREMHLMAQRQGLTAVANSHDRRVGLQELVDAIHLLNGVDAAME